MHRTGAADYL